MEAKKQLKKYMLRPLRFAKYKFLNMKVESGKILRRLGLLKDQYSELKALHNAYEGKRCFVICTGPSLTLGDLEKIKDEYTFGMNSICKLAEKMGWVPTFYGIQDYKVYESIKDNIYMGSSCTYFTTYQMKERFDLGDYWTFFPFNSYYHIYEHQEKNEYYVKFSPDCHEMVYNGYTITYSLIQIAVYLGFKEIYIIGADNNFNGPKRHIVEYSHVGANLDSAGDRMNVAYECAKKYADEHGIKIVNVTRGGMLEVFPRMSLEEVLGI